MQNRRAARKSALRAGWRCRRSSPLMKLCKLLGIEFIVTVKNKTSYFLCTLYENHYPP